MIAKGEYPVREGDGGFWVPFDAERPWHYRRWSGLLGSADVMTAAGDPEAIVTGSAGAFVLERVWIADRILVAMRVRDESNGDCVQVNPTARWYGGTFEFGDRAYELVIGDMRDQIRRGDAVIAEILSAWRDSDSKRGIRSFVQLHEPLPPVAAALFLYGNLRQIYFPSSCGALPAGEMCSGTHARLYL